MYDSEMEIFKSCCGTETEKVFIISGSEESVEYVNACCIYESIINSSDWLDNSANTNIPPDLINHKLQIFIEVMRFDDHSKNGKDNPTRARTSKMKEELFEKMPEAKNKNVFINAVTDLPTDEDHSYAMYIKGFQRVIKKHLSKLETYQNNFPNYKKAFLLFDESSGVYYELVDKLRKDIKIRIGSSALVQTHLFFYDKNFVDTFINSDLDYLIWYCPYKIDNENNKIDFPYVIFYDIQNFKNHKDELIIYHEEKMISNEM